MKHLDSRVEPELLHNYFEQYLNCRVYGHNWRERTGYRITEETLRSVIAEDTVTCAVCGTQRRDMVNITTTRVERVGRSYRYPDNYLTPGSGLRRNDFLATQVYRDLISTVQVSTEDHHQHDEQGSP